VTGTQGHFLGLEVLTKPQATHLDLARAYLALYDKYAAESYVLDSAYQRLRQLRDTSALVRQTWVHYWFNRADYAAITGWATSRSARTESDPWTAYRIGQAYAQQAQYPLAVDWLQRAVDLLPLDLDFREKLAVNLVATSQWDQARQLLLTVLADNPKRPLALLNLGYIAARQGQLDRAMAYYDQALDLDPDYTQALLNKTAIHLLRREEQVALSLVEQILAREPQNPTARQLWQELR
jgi:tetratricopeptide (TPR) repeat protein